MDFSLDAGQVELQRTIQRFCAERFPLDSIVERSSQPLGRSDWEAVAQLGVLGAIVPEERGGTGLGLLEATLVFEQLGSFVAPGPFLWSVASAELVDGVADGRLMIGGVSSGAMSDGVAIVQHPDAIDLLVVLGHHEVLSFRRADLDAIEDLEPFDPSTPVRRARVLGGGIQIGGPREADRLRLIGAVLSAAMLAGLANRALQTARTYALERHQFGVSIGSFQAVKHMLADMYVRSSLAQSATYAAAAVADSGGCGDVARAAASAKLIAGEAAIANSKVAVQVLGGMGFTWDMLPNFLLKRAWLLEHGFGDRDEQAIHISTMVAS